MAGLARPRPRKTIARATRIKGLELPIAKAALCVENGLRVSFLDCGQLLKPRLRRAEPELISRDQLIPLANRTDTQTDHFRTAPRSRVDRRASAMRSPIRSGNRCNGKSHSFHATALKKRRRLFVHLVGRRPARP
jgi:hypothetical protein